MKYQVGVISFDEADVKDMPGATQSLVVLANHGRDDKGTPLARARVNSHALAKKHIQAFLNEVEGAC